MENPTHLPVGPKFTLYRDENGDYVLESQQEKGLVLRGSTPDELVGIMAETIPEWEHFKVWARLEEEPISPESIMPVFENFQEMCGEPSEFWDKKAKLYTKLANVYFEKAEKALRQEITKLRLMMGYTDHGEEALKLNKEFESAQMEVLSRIDHSEGAG